LQPNNLALECKTTNKNIFLCHSNKYIEHTKYFAEFLRSRGLNPIVAEFTPNYGRSWTIPEKVEYLLSFCDAVLWIGTPDERQDGDWVPRMDVSYELGRIEDRKRTIILKEETLKLPTGSSPVYTSFSLKKPQDCLQNLDTELESIFDKTILKKHSFNLQPPISGQKGVLEIDGQRLVPERPDLIQNKVQEIFIHKSKQEQAQIVSEIIGFLDSQVEDERWVAGLLLEEVIGFDSRLVPRDKILKMSRDKSFSVRSASAVCLFALANLSPGEVPLDVVVRLASPDEDWYVYTPAVNTLKTLAHRSPRALDFLIAMSLSDDEDWAQQGIFVLFDVVTNDPSIVDTSRIAPLKMHKDKVVRETAEKITQIIKKQSGESNVIRYGAF